MTIETTQKVSLRTVRACTYKKCFFEFKRMPGKVNWSVWFLLRFPAVLGMWVPLHIGNERNASVMDYSKPSNQCRESTPSAVCWCSTALVVPVLLKVSTDSLVTLAHRDIAKLSNLLIEWIPTCPLLISKPQPLLSLSGVCIRNQLSNGGHSAPALGFILQLTAYQGRWFQFLPGDE